MTILDVSALLVLAGICDHYEPCSAEDADEKASWVLDACTGAHWDWEWSPYWPPFPMEKLNVLVTDSDPPLMLPHGAECSAVVVAIWAVESGGRFLAYPSGKWSGGGGGPMQIAQPVDCFYNSRIGRVCLPPHEMFGGATAIAHAVSVLRWKWHPSPERTFRRWNGGGHPGFVAAAGRAWRRIGR